LRDCSVQRMELWVLAECMKLTICTNRKSMKLFEFKDYIFGNLNLFEIDSDPQPVDRAGLFPKTVYP
jgi:hypothetical protein